MLGPIWPHKPEFFLLFFFPKFGAGIHESTNLIVVLSNANKIITMILTLPPNYFIYLMWPGTICDLSHNDFFFFILIWCILENILKTWIGPGRHLRRHYGATFPTSIIFPKKGIVFIIWIIVYCAVTASGCFLYTLQVWILSLQPHGFNMLLVMSLI